MTVDSLPGDEYDSRLACWGRVWQWTRELGTGMTVKSSAGDEYEGPGRGVPAARKENVPDYLLSPSAPVHPSPAGRVQLSLPPAEIQNQRIRNLQIYKYQHVTCKYTNINM